MSSTILRIIPTNPSFIPTKPNIESALAFLSRLYNRQQVEYSISDTIQFVDQGENFDSVNCDNCNKLIDIQAWQNAMDEASKTNFENLYFITPCCHKKTSLNDLKYNSPAGFSKFTISIHGAEEDLNKNNLQQLEALLGAGLRLIWAHY